MYAVTCGYQFPPGYRNVSIGVTCRHNFQGHICQGLIKVKLYNVQGTCTESYGSQVITGYRNVSNSNTSRYDFSTLYFPEWNQYRRTRFEWDVCSDMWVSMWQRCKYSNGTKYEKCLTEYKNLCYYTCFKLNQWGLLVNFIKEQTSREFKIYKQELSNDNAFRNSVIIKMMVHILMRPWTKSSFVRQWLNACSVRSHYLQQIWLMARRAFRKEGHFNRNT